MLALPLLVLDVEIDGLAALEGVPAGSVRDALNRAALMVGQYTKQLWVAMAHEVGAYDTGGYVRGIEEQGRIEIVKKALGQEDGQSFIELVVDITNTAKHASIVEEGHGAFSLPQSINWHSGAGSIKLNREGKPYLHIPFRHYTPVQGGDGATKTRRRGLMPQEVYEQARQLLFTMPKREGPVRRAGPETNPPTPGLFVQRDRYVLLNLGNMNLHGAALHRPEARVGFRPDKSTGQLFEEMRSARIVGRDVHGNDLRNPAWKSSKFEGMRRSGQLTAKGRVQSTYATIRTITPDSEGFNIPAQAGFYVAAKVGRAIQSGPHAVELFRSALAGALTGGSTA